MNASANDLPPGVSADAVLLALAQVLESKQFAQSERMRRFLRFAVERTLAGDRDSLKEFTIGIEVFDRSSDYDPRIDSIVRVEARRLRRKLRQYYEDADARPQLRIELPEGSYVPVLTLLSPAAVPGEPRSRSPLDQQTIAVLPFVNLTPDPENDYFADGLTEELINALAQSPPLRVVSRTSAFQFKNVAHDIREIGEKLGAARVLEGTVRSAGGLLRVTAQLVGVKDGIQLWSHRFDRRIGDLFTLQDEIAGAIAGVLRVPIDRPHIEWKPNHVVPGTAVLHVLEGRHFLQRMTPAGQRKAVECFQRAIAEDPDFASAYTGVAASLLTMSLFGDVSPLTVSAHVNAQLREALQRDPSLPGPYACRGLHRAAIEWNWPEAGQDFLRAVEINPSFADARYYYATAFLAPLGRFDEATAQLREALRSDPGSLVANTGLAITHYLRGDNDAALDQFERTLSLSPSYYGAHRMCSYALIRQGDSAEAVRLLESAQPLAEGDLRLVAALGHAYGRDGRRRKAMEVAAQLDSQSAGRYVAAYDRAMVRLGMGELDEACELLHAAAQERECWLIYTRTDPVFDAVRDHPGFRSVVELVFRTVPPHPAEPPAA